MHICVTKPLRTTLVSRYATSNSIIHHSCMAPLLLLLNNVTKLSHKIAALDANSQGTAKFSHLAKKTARIHPTVLEVEVGVRGFHQRRTKNMIRIWINTPLQSIRLIAG